MTFYLVIGGAGFIGSNIAADLVRLLGDQNPAKRIGEAGQARADESGARKMVSDVEDSYEELLAERACRQDFQPSPVPSRPCCDGVLWYNRLRTESLKRSARREDK